MFSDWKWPHNGQDIPQTTLHWTLFTHGQKGTPHGYDQIDLPIHAHLKNFKFQVFGLQVFGSNKHGLKTKTSDAASMRKYVTEVPQGIAPVLRLSGDCGLRRCRQTSGPQGRGSPQAHTVGARRKLAFPSPPTRCSGPADLPVNTSPFSSYLTDFTFFLVKQVLWGWHALGWQR